MNKWSPSAKFCASSAHMGWAAAFIVTYDDWNTLTLCIILIVWAAIKEYILDLFIIEHDSIIGSTLDFVTYMLGGIVGLIARHHHLAAFILAVILLILAALIDYLFQRQSPHEEYD